MGLQVFGVSKPRGRRHHVVGAKCGAIGKGRAIDPLWVSKPPGFEHLEIKRTARWKPFLECTKRKVLDPLRNVSPCGVPFLEAFATVGDT